MNFQNTASWIQHVVLVFFEKKRIQIDRFRIRDDEGSRKLDGGVGTKYLEVLQTLLKA